MISISLPAALWWYDPGASLGPPGGFGQVFAGGRADGDTSLAVKRLHLTANDAAHRELRIAADLAGRDLEWVVPILDSGQDAGTDRYFVVMERAETSLQERINSGPIDEHEAAVILWSIASGLVEISDLVHRDLKPANVLRHAGRWKIVDFGIARFVEESTSLNTLREALTPPYAAPEQWRLQRCSPTTDIYALGCIAHAVLTGAPPFTGPRPEDYANQHLTQTPPTLAQIGPQFRGLINMMLRKEPETRPSAQRVVAVLNELVAGTVQQIGAARSELAQAGAAVAEEEARSQAEARARAEAVEHRRRISQGAVTELAQMMEVLFSRITDGAPAARVGPDGMQVTLGRGTLAWRVRLPSIDAGAFRHSGWEVFAGAEIEVTQSSEQYRGRSASLWFTDAGQSNSLSMGDGVRWIEVPYMYGGSSSRVNPDIFPFGVASLDDADIAHSGVSGAIQSAATPVPIDGEAFESFADRWVERLAKAALLRLERPWQLPER